MADAIGSQRGRPRDPDIERRIVDATLILYGETGWIGFTMDAVVRHAKVSKDALYRRWKSREALLADALRTRWDWVGTIDTGTLRGDLLALGTRLFATFTGPHGEAGLQLIVDARRFPRLADYAAPFQQMLVHEGRSIARHGVARGELPASVNPGLVLDLLSGAIINHVVSTPDHLRDRMAADSDAFIETIVSVILGGIQTLDR